MAAVERVVAEGVWKRFGPTVALRGVDLRLEAGSVTALVGPNGSGKSTLLAVLGAALRPDRGSVRFEPLGDDPALRRAALGWVAHESRCYPDLTARQNVALAARLHGLDADAAWARAEARFDTRALADRRVGTLSRGQKQRVALARALLHEPAVVLLDEAWTGLDAAASEALDGVVAAERARGAVVVAVTHDAAAVGRVATRCVRLEGGRVVADDPV